MAQENDAIGHVISPVCPLGALIRGHTSPDQVDVVCEQTQRKRPSEESQQSDSRPAHTAHVEVDGCVDEEVVSLPVEVSKPALRVYGLLGAVSIPSFILQVMSVDQRRKTVVGQICAIRDQNAGG